jgi:hypothetical protein
MEVILSKVTYFHTTDDVNMISYIYKVKIYKTEHFRWRYVHSKDFSGVFRLESLAM